MSCRLFQVDAFTATAFAGNPAGVCLLESSRSESWMQQVAAEMNVAETAFVVPSGDQFDLRWFTPTVEMDLCGHATLATAHILWEEHIRSAHEEAIFMTRSGRLGARRTGEWIELDFPAEPCLRPRSATEMAAMLGTEVVNACENRMDILVELPTEAAVRNLKPDLRLLKDLPGRGVIVTARSNSRDYDFISRFFAPAVGIDEDPVTGSAHCCLAPYWSERLNKIALTGYQASARGGVLVVEVSDGRVLLRGQAVTIIRGELLA